MKRFLVNILHFSLVAIVGYMLLLFLFGDLGWVRTANSTLGNTGHLNSRIKDIPNYHDIDVLFLGSSHCYRTFDTRFYSQHGYKCFNLGSSNQTPMQTLVLLKDYLDSLRPRRAVMEVHQDILDNDGVECSVDLLTNAPITCNSTAMVFKVNNMRVYNTWLYNLYSQRVRHRLEQFVEDTVIDQAVYQPGGYVKITGRTFERKRYPRRDIHIRPEQMDALKECIAMLRERDIPVLLVEVQDAKQLRSTFKNHPWFEQQMTDLAPYYYPILPMIDTVHFANSNHLYQPGIDLFNQHFVQVLDCWFATDTLPSPPREEQ